VLAVKQFEDRPTILMRRRTASTKAKQAVEEFLRCERESGGLLGSWRWRKRIVAG
jgi:hypothetical protein